MIASNALRLATIGAVKRTFLGKLKPTHVQLGWSYGFCDSYAQHIGLEDDEDFIVFISMVFGQVFKKNGERLFERVAFNQEQYSASIMKGGTAHNSWAKQGVEPLMPRAT